MTVSPTYAVPPVERAFKLLRAIAGGDDVANMSETARRLGLSRTTLIRLVGTLEAEQMIERAGAGYRLGLGLAGLAGRALAGNDIVQAGDPILRALTQKLSLSSHIGVLSGRDVLYMARQTPNVHLVSNVGVGSHLPAHATTLGRIILAHMPRDDVRELFHGARLKAATSKTPTTIAALIATIDRDLAEGIAWSDSHFEVGIASAAAAIFDSAGRVAGAMNVTGPSAMFETSAQRRRDIGTAVRDAALQVSRRLGYMADEAPAPQSRDQKRRQQ